MQKLSKATDGLLGQPMFQTLTKIKEMERNGVDVVHFEIGDPDFDTPTCIREALIKAVRDGYTHYSSAIGDYELRQTICETGIFSPFFTPDIDQVLISPSANILFYYAVRCLVDKDEEVIIPDPSFSTYKSVLSFCDVKTVLMPLDKEHEYKVTFDRFIGLVTDKTKLVVINSPNNPTGAVSEPKELEKIGKYCLDKGIYLFCDEIYSYLNYSGNTLYSPSILDKCKERMIIATGFSKTFAMTGWRLGVAIAPKELIEKMALLLETTSSCTPTFIQKAAIVALEEGLPDVQRMVSVYKERRDYLVKRLNSMPLITCPIPQGAFYVFPNIEKTNCKSKQLANQLLEKAHIGVSAGTDFGCNGEGHIRLCYATSMERIQEGMDRLEKYLTNLRE